jgi:phosphatidate cytidylyltransferase
VLKQRVLSSIVLIPIVLALTYMGGPYFAILVAVVALLAGYEFYHIVQQAGYRPSYVVGLLSICILLIDAYQPHLQLWRWGLAAAVMLSMVWQVLHKDMQGFLTGWALNLAGALYVGGLCGHMILLRNLPGGLGWLLLAFAGTWTCDTFAYFVGVYLGKHGFFTHVSPHKTWEGAIGGALAGILATVAGGHLLGLTFWQGLLLAIPLVVGITFGDLAESLIKRQVGVKDSGGLIPGHGGMLDRIDSLMFACVIVYYFVRLVAR